MLSRIVEAAKLVACGLAIAAIVGCGAGDAQPAVPTSSVQAAGEGVIKFPVRDDGSVDRGSVAEISFEEPAYDFGYVDAGAIVTHRFAFRNTGAQPLTITRAVSTCGCTVPEYPEGPIAVGDTASVLVRFDTEAKSGPQDKAVTLTANTYPNETVVRLVGTVD